MNKFLTFQGKQPLYLGDIDFASDAIRSAFSQLLAGLVGSDSPNAIIYGVTATERSSSVVFSAGVVSIDGEILPVEANAGIAGSLADTFYLRIKSAYGGTRTFEGGASHDCWETRTVEVTKDETDYPLASFRRIQGGFGSQIWRYNSGSANPTAFRLVKTGLVWLITLRRPPMTQSDEHLFEISVPTIQSDDLVRFPTAEAMVPATAYIDTGEGLTAEPMTVKYYRADGNLHIEMDLASGLGAAGNVYMQVILPVF